MEYGWWLQDLKPFGVTAVKEFGYPSGEAEMQAMIMGDLDIACVGIAPAIQAIDKGLDAKVIAAVDLQGSNLMLRPGLKFIGPQSLIGLNIATFPPSSVQDLVLRKWLKDNGINISQLNILPMTPGDAITLMSEGKVDGAFLPNPGPGIIKLEGIGEYAIASGEMWPNHACCCLVASGSLIRDNPAIVKQIVITHIKATDYINKYPDEAAKIYANRTGQDIEVIRYALHTWDGKWVSEPNLQVPSAIGFASIDYKMNYTSKPLKRDDIFDTSFFDTIASTAA